MVKKNKILVGCLALLLALSVGYALFSETITINGTATAKGSFDITTTCAPGLSSELMVAMGAPEGISGDEGQSGFANSVCNVNDNTVTMTTDLLYPTSKRLFTVKMTNTGSIPALIYGASKSAPVEDLHIDSNNSGSWALKNKETDDIIKSGAGEYGGVADYVVSSNYIIISKDGSMNADNNVVYDSEKGYVGLKLNPGDNLFVVMGLEYPEGANSIFSDNGKSEYLEFIINHEFKWEQYTDNPNYEDANFSDYCFNGC